MTLEIERGCGYRKPNGLYLISLGKPVSCDRLPVPIAACPCCGFVPHQVRSFAWVSGRWLGDHRGPRIMLSGALGGGRGKSRGARCKDAVAHRVDHTRGYDPICEVSDEPRLLSWVGRKFYTPESFADEAGQLGVSKRVPDIPDGLVLGRTWVLMAHPDACADPLSWGLHWLFEDGEVSTAPGVFQAFVVERIEIVLHESEATQVRIDKEAKRGVDVVIVPDGAVDARVSWRPGEPRPSEAPPLPAPPIQEVPAQPVAVQP
jgi:hypothetical protein